MASLVDGQRCMLWLLLAVLISSLLQSIPANADLETSRSYLHLKLLNERTGEKREITYIMSQHSVSRKFEFLVHRHLTSLHEIQSLAWAVFPRGRSALVNTHKELKAHMDFIDNFQHEGRYLFQFKHKLPPLGLCDFVSYHE